MMVSRKDTYAHFTLAKAGIDELEVDLIVRICITIAARNESSTLSFLWTLKNCHHEMLRFVGSKCFEAGFFETVFRSKELTIIRCIYNFNLRSIFSVDDGIEKL